MTHREARNAIKQTKKSLKHAKKNNIQCSTANTAYGQELALKQKMKNDNKEIKKQARADKKLAKKNK